MSGSRSIRAVEQVLHPEALAVAQRAGLPAWLLLAGPHREFELVFTVPEDRVMAFLDAAGRIGWQPVALGCVTAEPAIPRSLGDEWRVLDTRRFRDLYRDVNGDARRYVSELLAPDRPATPPWFDPPFVSLGACLLRLMNGDLRSRRTHAPRRSE